VLEDEIEAELRRQEELLKQIDQQEKTQASANAAISGTLTQEELEARADPRSAPEAPKDRELPLSIFDESRATIAKQSWENERELVVVKRSLDADRDGKAEEVRYFDEKSGELVRKEQDRDYDGRPDAWTVYEKNQIVSRTVDGNSDGKVDAWEKYAGGRMLERQIDRDGDGVRDAFYRYEGDSLVEEKHDADNDGAPDLIVSYEKRMRTQSLEDADRNGKIDTWTTYQIVDKEEVVSRIERDSDGNGKPDVFESFAAQKGRPVLARREEDKNGDGTIDVTSVYENGKLVRREIADPSLTPL
jgi:hypothetical protein